MAESSGSSLSTNPRHVIAAYLILTFGLSSIFWYIIATKPQFFVDTGIGQYSIFFLMWCPALAAIITRFGFQRNLKGFGFKIGELRWYLLAIAIPIIYGGVMFGTAWISGTAPFLPDKAAAMLTLPVLQAILIAICYSIVSATGEELGWRGLLVPELGRVTGFTQVAIISAFVWFLWHVPVMLAGGYQGSGGLLYSMVIFFLAMFGASTLFAWIRLKSGSVWPAALLHGVDNFFIQSFYPKMTATTEAGEAMLGEFGWFVVLVSIVIGLLFWYLRFMLPEMPKPDGGL